MKTLLLLLISIAAMSCQKNSDPAPITQSQPQARQKYLMVISPNGPYNSLTIKRDTATVAYEGNTNNSGGWMMYVDVYPENKIYYDYDGAYDVNLKVVKYTTGPIAGEHVYINESVSGQGVLDLSSLPK